MVYTKWSDWSKCEAPDCERDPNLAFMTRSQTNVADETDIRTDKIRCKSPCPPGKNDDKNKVPFSPSQLSKLFLLPDCSVLKASVTQTPIGYRYHINQTVSKPKTENISQVVMVGFLIFPKTSSVFALLPGHKKQNERKT